MKKVTLFDWLLYIAKAIGMLAIPTLLCGFAASFKAAFQTWALMLAFFIPLISGFLVISNYIWKRKLASFLRAIVIGISFFTTSVVGMAISIQEPSWRNFTGITIDSQASIWRQVLFTSATLGFIVFVASVFSIAVSPVIRLMVKEIFKEQ